MMACSGRHMHPSSCRGCMHDSRQRAARMRGMCLHGPHFCLFIAAHMLRELGARRQFLVCKPEFCMWQLQLLPLHSGRSFNSPCIPSASERRDMLCLAVFTLVPIRSSVPSSARRTGSCSGRPGGQASATAVLMPATVSSSMTSVSGAFLATWSCRCISQDCALQPCPHACTQK